MPQQPPPPQRSRVEDGIAESALHLLRTGGSRAVTVEAVAAHSGIAKTTIYRRHLDRRDMLTSALSRMAAPEPLDPETGAPERLRWFIRHAVEAIEDGIGPGGFAALLTESDPEFTTLFRQILVGQRAKLAAAIDAGKADGSMRSDIDSESLIDGVVGAYIAERARTGVIADGWQERLFSLFWPTVRA
ncbi:AcrR family transcriptional regulator [Mycobacterium frederiksbergense]|uniref:AcrR family transcriptional regulator n=1 Tax=Mycolicibacterium frederiksbergense TaxID=117567 RepID=A0ABT6L202_9MYCO|nr:TetR family transcriptional regulator [Mycolicibacterium frederiksbergense]MDH6196980.1 AcrR family transcriptional regulator [Mycolicibacterium frederiksbergense]